MHHNGISPAAQELVQRYGEMSYAQLVAALRAPVLSQKANERARGQRPQPAAVEKLELRLERYREISGMSPGDLDQLRREIQARVEFCAWRTQRYHQTDGTYALLVESPLRRQIWLYSRERWRECLVPLIPQRQTEMKNSTSRNRHESGEEH